VAIFFSFKKNLEFVTEYYFSKYFLQNGENLPNKSLIQVSFWNF